MQELYTVKCQCAGAIPTVKYRHPGAIHCEVPMCRQTPLKVSIMYCNWGETFQSVPDVNEGESPELCLASSFLRACVHAYVCARASVCVHTPMCNIYFV